MDASHPLLFVQYRSSRAGAQTSLLRLLNIPAIAGLNPATLLAEDGWLSDALLSIPSKVVVKKWPSPRSFYARIGGLAWFAKNLAKELRDKQIEPKIIIANDHQECPLVLALAREFKAKTIVVLRSSGMNQKDFDKYQCGKINHIFAVGAHLAKKVSLWSNSPVPVLQEGFTNEELSTSPPSSPSLPPKRLLIVGTSDPAKGIGDFLAALQLVEQSLPNLHPLECVFTCDPPEDPSITPLLAFTYRSKLTFQGRVNGLIDFTKNSNFDFAIHPSRREAFGMAPLELILAGIPTLCSRTGVLGDLNFPESWLFACDNPKDLADKLELWLHHWPEPLSAVASIQSTIQSKFPIEKTSAELITTIEHVVKTTLPSPTIRTI